MGTICLRCGFPLLTEDAYCQGCGLPIAPIWAKALAFLPPLTVGTLTLDPLRRHVERDGRTLDLSARELALLEFLMRNAGRTVSRARIAEAVWRHQFDTDTNVVDVYINYLRKKLTFRGDAPPIKTVRGVGYRLDPAGP